MARRNVVAAIAGCESHACKHPAAFPLRNLRRSAGLLVNRSPMTARTPLKSLRNFLVAVAITTAALPGSLWAVELHVDPSGDDANSGSKSAPLKTFAGTACGSLAANESRRAGDSAISRRNLLPAGEHPLYTAGFRHAGGADPLRSRHPAKR